MEFDSVWNIGYSTRKLFHSKGSTSTTQTQWLTGLLASLVPKNSSMQESQTQSNIVLNFTPDVTLPGCVCNTSSQRPLLTAGKARLLLWRTPPQTVRVILQVVVLLYKFGYPTCGYMWIRLPTVSMNGETLCIRIHMYPYPFFIWMQYNR